MRKYNLIALFALLLVIPLVYISANDTPILPEVEILQVGNNTAEWGEIEEGKQPYHFMVSSLYGQVFVDVWMENMDTGEKITIFSENWIDPFNAISDTFEAQEGYWKFFVKMQDEQGNTNLAELGFIVKKPNLTDVEILSVTRPIVVADGDTRGTLEVELKNNTRQPAFVEVAWKWADSGTWQASQTIELETVLGLSSGKGTVNFSIPTELPTDRPRAIEIEVRTANQLLKDSTFIIYNYPKVVVKDVVVTDYDAVTGDLLLRIVVFSESQDWIISSTVAEVVVVKDGQQLSSFHVPLDVGETKEVVHTVKIPKGKYKLTVLTKEVAKQYPDRAGISRNINLTDNFTNLIAIYAKNNGEGPFREGQTIYTIAKFKMAEKSKPINELIDINLTFNGQIVATDKILLTPGEEKEIVFRWTLPMLPNKEYLTGTVIATINPAELYDEITYEDNEAIANIVIMPDISTNISCDAFPDNRSAVSAYVDMYYWDPPIWDEDCDYWVDEEGEEHGGCWDVLVKPGECLYAGTTPYYEYITIDTPAPIPNPVKAGMGFTLNNLQTAYRNTFNGIYPISIDTNRDFKRVLLEGMDQKLDMVALNPFPNSNNDWIVPRARITRGQGDMNMVKYFEQATPFHPLDTNAYTDGDNKFYTSFFLKDGILEYVYYGSKAGTDEIVRVTDKSACEGGGVSYDYTGVTPRLSFCVEGQVEIKGSPHDDYIIRRINPHNPFPQNGRRGWNWVGYDHIFEELKEWYDTSGGVILDNSINWIIDNR